METLFGKMRSLDAYPKINEDFYSRTLSDGVITLDSSIFMLLLFISELRMFDDIIPDCQAALPCSIVSLDAMDISGEQHMDVRHDIIKRRIDAHGNFIETRLDTIGAPKIELPLQRHGGRLEHNETHCGSCYGAEVKDENCCNNCEEVREAHRNKGWALLNPDSIDQCKREVFLQRIKEEEGERCNLYGFLDVNKVASNFHFPPGKSFQQSNVHVHDLLAFQKDSFNRFMIYTNEILAFLIYDTCCERLSQLNFVSILHISHKVNRLAFGDYFPGVMNPLDGVQWTQQTPNAMYQYLLQVVPTVFTDETGIPSIQIRCDLNTTGAFNTLLHCKLGSFYWKGREIHNIPQFSVTEHVKVAELGRLQALPGVFFFYDLSPIKVAFTETHVSFLHFLTNVCAIVGGVFIVSGIIDSFVYHSQKAIKRKMELGKFS